MTPPPGGPRNLLGYQPALDGLRGLALMAIFFFHAEFLWAPGAFLSVSTFFTLSGFLITVLLIGEHRSSGTIALRDFWARRFRRLLPASLVVIAGVLLATKLWGSASQLSGLREDALSCLGYAANWRFIASGQGYSALFSSKSPLQHFWSLAIEEQFYVIYPVIVAVVLRIARGTLRGAAIGLGGLAALSIGSSLFGLNRDYSLDRLYFGTDVRAAELLVGGIVALWWVHQRRDSTAQQPLRIVQHLGLPALIAMLVLWRFAERTDRFWYQGGLALYSLLTAIVVVAAVAPDGPVRRALSFRPIVALGLISYGAYLIHWPVFVFIDRSTDLGQWPLFALRVAITIALAYVSYYMVEQPVRLRKVSTAVFRVAAPVGLAVVIAATFLVTAGHDSTGDLNSAKSDYEKLVREAQRNAANKPPATGPKFTIYGDSTALMVALGVGGWSQDHPDRLHEMPGGFTDLGCGLLEIPRRIDGKVGEYADQCRNWPQRWDSAARDSAAKGIETALVVIGPWEVSDGKLPGSDTFTSIGDPAYDAATKAALENGLDILLRHHKLVLILDSPYIERGRVDGVSPERPSSQSSRARMDGWNRIVREVAAARPRVRVIPYSQYFEEHSDEDRRLRPDGIHLVWGTSSEVAQWLGPLLASTIAAELPPATAPQQTPGAEQAEAR